MKQVQGVRRELRMRTMFNLLGPLTNPARASGQVVGVYSLDLVEKLAEALSMLGLRRALVVHGLDGLDEITITGITRVAEAREGISAILRSRTRRVRNGSRHAAGNFRRRRHRKCSNHPRDLEWREVRSPRMSCSSTPPPRWWPPARADHIAEAVPLAAKSIDSGSAARKLDALVEVQLGVASRVMLHTSLIILHPFVITASNLSS